MSIEKLTEMVTPPPNPVDNGGSGKWSEIEKKLGTPLPHDYKAYINTYGTGNIGNMIIIYNPFSGNKRANLFDMIPTLRDVVSTLPEESGEEALPYKLYPETGGLLPFGTTDNGDMLFWHTKGEPSAWTVVLYEARGPLHEEHDRSMTEFLSDYLAGKLSSDVLPEAQSDAVAFVPISHE